MMKKTLVGIAVVGVLGLCMTVAAGEVAPPKTPEDLLAMTDAEAVAFAVMAAPTMDFAKGARFYRVNEKGELKLLKDGTGPWNFIAGVPVGSAKLPASIAPMVLDEEGMKWLRAKLAGQEPKLERVGVGFLWAGNQLYNPETRALRPILPNVMVIWPLDAEATGLGSRPGLGIKPERGPKEVRVMLPKTPYAHVVVPVPGVDGPFTKGGNKR